MFALFLALSAGSSLASKVPTCWDSNITGLAIDCTSFGDEEIEVRTRALNGFIVGQDSLGIRYSQPAGARQIGEASSTDIGDDRQDWAIFTGSCPYVSSRLPSVTYRRCSDNVMSDPYDGFDSIQLQACNATGIITDFRLSLGIAKTEADLAAVVNLQRIQPTKGPPSGGTAVNLTVSGLDVFNDTQVLEIYCEFGASHTAMSTIASWSPYSDLVRCSSPPLSRRLVGAPEKGDQDNVTIPLHLYYYVFNDGWKRSDSVDFTFQPDVTIPVNESQPRVERVLPGLIRFPRMATNSPPLHLVEVELVDPPPASYLQSALQRSSGTKLYSAARNDTLRCRFQATSGIQVQVEASLTRGPFVWPPLSGSGAEGWPRVLCHASDSSVNTMIATYGSSWITDALVQISTDAGQTWSSRADSAMVTLAGPETVKVTGLFPQVRLLNDMSNLSVRGTGFEWFRVALKQGHSTGASLECVWLPSTSSAYLRDLCHVPASIINDTVVTCLAASSSCMRHRGAAGFQVNTMQLRYGLPGALSSLALPCEGTSCLHVAIPEPLILQETQSVSDAGGPVVFQVAGVDSAADGLLSIHCRFRHVEANLLGPMPTRAYLVKGQLEDDRVTCSAPNWNTSLEGGFGGTLTYRTDEVWQWLVDFSLDSTETDSWFPSMAAEVNVTRLVPVNPAPSEENPLPPAKNVTAEVIPNSTCWWYNHSSKDVQVATGPLHQAVELLVPALLIGDGTMLCNASTGDGGGLQPWSGMGTVPGTPAYNTSQNMIAGLDLMVPTNKSDGSMLRLQGKSLWGSKAPTIASKQGTVTPTFAVVPSILESSALPEAVILIGYGFVGKIWLCRWSPANSGVVPVTYMGMVVNDTALSCPVALEIHEETVVASARWELQATVESPPTMTVPLVIEILPKLPVLYHSTVPPEASGDCLEQINKYQFRFGPCFGLPVTCAMSKCRLLPLIDDDNHSISEGRSKAIRDDLQNVSWTPAEVISDALQGDVLCDVDTALRRAPQLMSKNTTRPYLVVAICGDSQGQRPPARIASKLLWMSRTQMETSQDLLPTKISSVPQEVPMALQISEVQQIPEVWLEDPTLVTGGNHYGSLTFRMTVRVQNATSADSSKDGADLTSLLRQPAVCRLSSDLTTVEDPAEEMVDLELTYVDRGLVPVVSSISGVLEYDGLVQCEFRIPRLSAWALLYSNRSATIRESPSPYIDPELEVSPASYQLQVSVAVGKHRTAWTSIPAFKWTFGQPEYVGNGPPQAVAEVPSPPSPPIQAPQAPALHENWTKKATLGLRLSPSWGFTEDNETFQVETTLRIVTIVGVFWPRPVPATCVWAREEFRIPDHVLSRVPATGEVGDSEVLADIRCPLPPEILGAPLLSSLHLGLEDTRGTALPSMSMPLWTRPHFWDVSPKLLARTRGQSVTLQASNLPAAVQAWCLLNMESEDVPVVVEARVRSSSVQCLLKDINATLQNLRGAASQKVHLSVSFHENLEWVLPTELYVEVVDPPEAVMWTPHVAAGAMLSSTKPLEVLIQVPGETTVMSTYNHWYCAWRSTEEANYSFFASSRLMYLNTSFVVCPLNFANYKNFQEASSATAFQLYYALSHVPLGVNETGVVETSSLVSSPIRVYLATNVRILGAVPQVQSTGAFPMIHVTGSGLSKTIYALISKPWLDSTNLLAKECRLCQPQSDSLLCPYTATGLPGEAVVNVSFYLVDPSTVEEVLQLQEVTPCQDGELLATESLTVFQPAVGPFTVHPTTVPAHATVRFAVSGLFSAYEAQYCSFRMTWPAETGYSMQLSKRVQAVRINSTLLLCSLETPEMPNGTSSTTLAKGELLLCTPGSCLDESTLAGFGVQLLSTMEVFVRPSLEPESSALSYVRGASGDQTLLISFGSTGQLPVSILPCMVQMGWSSPILCEAVREEAFYAADLRCRIPTNSSWILQSPQLQCAGSSAGYSPIAEPPFLPVSDLALPVVTSQSVFDLHVDAADLLRYGSGAESESGRSPSEAAGADVVLLRLGISLSGWEGETADLVRNFVEGCRLWRSAPVARRAREGSSSADGVADYITMTNGSYMFYCRFEVSSGIQDMVPWNDQEAPSLNLSLRFRSGLWFDTQRSVKIHPRITGARALPSACADSHHCALLVMGSGFTLGAAYSCVFSAPGALNASSWLVSPAQVLNSTLAMCISPATMTATNSPWPATHVSIVQGEVPLASYGRQDFLLTFTDPSGPASPILEAPTQIDLLPQVSLQAVAPSCLVLSESLQRGDDEAAIEVSFLFQSSQEETMWNSPKIEKLVACRLSLMSLYQSGAASWQQVVTTVVKWIKPGHLQCIDAHQRWIKEYGHLSDVMVGGGHLFDRRSEIQIDLVTLSSIPQVLSDKVYLPLVRKPSIAEVSPKTIQIARSSTALPHLRLTGTGIHTGLDGCCTISTDQAEGSPKEDRLKVLTRPTWLYRWPGAPPKSWRRNAKAEGPFSARCEMPPDVVEMVGRKLFVTYSPNCQQFPVQGHWVDLVVAPTIHTIWPSEVIFDATQPTRVTANGIGFIGEDLRLRIAGRLAMGLQVHNESAISFVPPAPPLRSPEDASEAFLIEVSLDGGLFWISSGVQLTYKHLPAIFALAPTLIVQGDAIQLNISGSLTFAGEVISLQAPPLHPLPSKVRSVFAASEVNGSDDSDGLSRLNFQPIDTSADPAVWMMTEGSNFTLSRPYWNCGSQVVEAGMAQKWFYCSGSDGTIRVVDQNTGRLVYAVASVSGNSTSVLGMPSQEELLVLDGQEVLLWQLGEKASKETPPPLPQLECRLLSDTFVSEVVPGRRLSKDEASCDLPVDLNFLRRDKFLPAATYPFLTPLGLQQLQVRPASRAADWLTIGSRIQFLPQLRVVSVNPAAAAVNLVTETVDGVARYARRISEIDGTVVAVLDGDFQVNLTMEPLDAAIAMQSSPSVCRVTSTGPSGRGYTFNLTWVSLTTARCGPLTTNHPFPSLHRLKLEVSPNGVQWFLAPRPVALFEQTQFHSMSPQLAALNSPRWITIRGIGFPRGIGLKILVEISPGFFRQALRVNSTALRFRSPTSTMIMNASVWVTFGGAPAKDTGFILRLVDSPSVSSVSPPAISVGEPQGTETRRPINVYGQNFRSTDECIFQSASMVQPQRVPLYSYISSTHVQCRAPGVALSDAIVPAYTPEEIDACEVYTSLQTRINTLRNQVNAMKIEALTRRDSDRPGCFGDCEVENLTFINGTLLPWYMSEPGWENETNSTFDLDNLSYEVSRFVPTAEQVALEQETDRLIFEANVEYLKCVAQQAAPAVVQARARGGFLLAQIWSPDLLDQQLTVLSDAEAFPVRLLPRLGISFVTPDSGPVTGGTLIAVVGNGFTQQGRLSCAFDDNLYMPARYFNESLIYCTTPAYHPAGVAKLKVASWLHELSLTSVDFIFYPRWVFSLQEEAACFAGGQGDSVVLYASEAEFMEWRYSVYNALCLFTTVGPPTRVFDAEATIYAWNSTMRVVCPCPALSYSDSASDSINVSISLDGKATISDVLGQPVRILKAPEVHHMAPSIWTVGSNLDLVIQGANFPANVELACALYDLNSQGYIFESFGIRQASMWQGLIEDSCPDVPEVEYTHQWQDVRESHCSLAGANVSYNGALAFIMAEYVSSEELRCRIPPQAMTLRGHMMTNRSILAYLVAKKNTGYLTQVAELPNIYVLPVVQIRQIDPEVSVVVERNDTSSVEPLLIRVLGEQFFFKHMARSDQRRCKLEWDFPLLQERYFTALVLNETEVVCRVQHHELYANEKAYLSVTIDGSVWSNALPIFFVRQASMHSHGPNLVPPFQSISLNLTTTAESLLQYQVLKRATTAWCDFGMPSVAAPTPAVMLDPNVIPGKIAEDDLRMQAHPFNTTEQKVLRRMPNISWTCHSPDGGFPPDVNLSVSLVFSPDRPFDPALSLEPMVIQVLPTLDAAQTSTPLVMVGLSELAADIKMTGPVPSHVQPLCRMENCYDVDFVNGSVATEFGHVRNQEDGLLSCPLPQVRRLWSGLSGRSTCQLRVSLNGGVHWSEPPIAMDVIAAPSLFDASPVRVSADSGTDMFCEKCTILDIVGSHLNHAIGNGTISPRCWLGEHEGSVVSVAHNITKCSFHSGPLGIRQDRMTSDSVALGNGLFGVSLTGPVLKDPMTPKPSVMVFVADPPVINQIRPTVVFQEPGRRLYVYGAHFPPDTGGDCAFFLNGTSGHSRVMVPSVNLNSSLVICPLPQTLRAGIYEIMIRFKGGMVAQPHVDQKPVFEVLDPLHVSQFRPSLVGPRRPVPVILDGVSAPLQELEEAGSFESKAIYCMWFVYESQHQTGQGTESTTLPDFISEAAPARVMRCTDPEVTRFCACGHTLKGCQEAEHLVSCLSPVLPEKMAEARRVNYTAKLQLSTDAGRLHYPINLDLRLAWDPLVLPLPKGNFSKVFAGTSIEVRALNVQEGARCQFRAYGSNGRLLLDAQLIGSRCGRASASAGNISNDTEVDDPMDMNGTVPEHTATPCPRVVDDYRTDPEHATSILLEETSSTDSTAGFQSTSRVRCRIPETSALGIWQVGVLNYDSLFAVAQNFVPFEVLQKSIVGRVSPNATALGSNTPLVLYGGPLGSLLRETQDSRCIFQPDGFDGEAESTPWVLDSQRVACFPPSIPGLQEGRKVKITLKIHGTSLPSEASFMLYPQRQVFTVPLGGETTSSNVKVQVGLVGQEVNMSTLPVKLLAQNTQFQGHAQVKLWVAPTNYSAPTTGSFSLVEIPLVELSLLLSAPVVDYSVTFPPGMMFSTYFVDPDEAAPSNLGLLVRGVATVEVSPSMLLYTPKVTAVYPRMLPWLDRSRRVPDFEEDPSLLVIGLGFVNTNRLRCRVLDTAGHTIVSPYAMFISATQVRCKLPLYELPGTSNVTIQVSNDGAEWSQEIYEVYIISAAELWTSSLAPAFGATTGNNTVQVTTASALPRVATLGCLFGLGAEARSEAVFLGSNDILCIADQPVKSLSLRRAGHSDPGGTSREVGFRLTYAPAFGRTGDPQLTTSKPTKFVYTRTPNFFRLQPDFGPVNVSVLVKGKNYPFDDADPSQVQCFWSLTRLVTNGTLLSGTELRCPSPSELPIIQLTSQLGSVDHLSEVSFDGGRNFHPVAAEGLVFTILHGGVGPLAAALAPTSVLMGRGEIISFFGGDFFPIRQLAPAFGYCTFAWNVTYPKNLTNDTGVRSATAVYVSQREVQCQVPLDLPPVTHAVRLFFTQGGSTFEARYGIPEQSWLNLTVFPSFAIHDPMPAWAPRAGRWQVSLPGSRILPLLEDDYHCTFGSAPATAALRVSLNQVLCQSALHEAGHVGLQLSWPSSARRNKQWSEKPFEFIKSPMVRWARPVILYAYETGQTLHIAGDGFSNFAQKELLCRFGGQSLEGTGAQLVVARMVKWNASEMLECNVPEMDPGFVTVHLVMDRRHEILITRSLQLVVKPSTISISPRVFVEGSRMPAAVLGYHLAPLRTHRLQCRFWASASKEPFDWLQMHVEKWLQLIRQSKEMACFADAVNRSERSSDDSTRRLSSLSNMSEDSDGVENVSENDTGVQWWNMSLAPEEPPYQWFSIDLEKECQRGPPLRTSAEALKCPSAILMLMERFLSDTLSEGINVAYRGWCPENMTGMAGHNVTNDGLLGEEQRVLDQLNKLRRREVDPGSMVYFDTKAFLDPVNDHLASCHVPKINDFFAAFEKSSLNYSYIVKQEVQQVFSEVAAFAWSLCSQSSCDRVLFLRLLAVSEAAWERWFPRVGHGRPVAPPGQDQLLSNVYVELGLADRMSERPQFLHWHSRIAIFPAPTISMAWPAGTAGRRSLHAQGRHLHPSLEPQCIMELENETLVLFPAIQTSQNMLRCSLTEREYNALPQNLTFLFTSEVDVTDVPIIPRENRTPCINRSIMEETNQSDATLSQGLANQSEEAEDPPLCFNQVEPCGEQQLVDEMVTGLRIQYNTNANMLAGINPNLVHVDGGAEVSIYGDFPVMRFGVALKASWRGIEHVVFPKWSSGVLHQVVLLALDEFS